MSLLENQPKKREVSGLTPAQIQFDRTAPEGDDKLGRVRSSSEILVKGLAGEDVKALQERLNIALSKDSSLYDNIDAKYRDTIRANSGLKTDGKFGSQTEAVVLAIQTAAHAKDSNFTVDAKVGRQMIGELDKRTEQEQNSLHNRVTPPPPPTIAKKTEEPPKANVPLAVNGSTFEVVGTPTAAERQTITNAIASFGAFVPTLAARDLPGDVAAADGRPARIVIADEANIGDGLKTAGINQGEIDEQRGSYVEGRTQGVMFPKDDVVAVYTHYSKTQKSNPGGELSANILSNVVRHEFGHALDDRLAPDDAKLTRFLSDDPEIKTALTKDWERRAKDCKLTADEIDQIKKSHGKDYYPNEDDPVWKIYEAKGKDGFFGRADFARGFDSPSEQIADGVELYLGGDAKRAELKTKSPLLFATIDHLFTGKQHSMSNEALALQFKIDITGQEA